MQRGWPPTRAIVAAVTFSLACGSAGCARQLDLTKAREPGQPVVLIPYTAVHEETRLYPDYGHLGASILTEDAAAKPPRKKGKSP